MLGFQRTFKMVLHVSALLSAASGACAAQSGGLAPEWDVRKNLAAVAANAQRLKPILEQLTPQEWVGQGASATYVAQWKTSLAEVRALAVSAENLVQEPEKLSAALDCFFRIQSLELMLNSLAAGVRRYQNPAVADLLQSVLGESSAGRDKLRQYVIDLAAAKEEEFRVVDREAQRCRGQLATPPGAAKKPASRKEEAK